MSSPNDQPTLYLPALPENDGHVDPLEVPDGLDLEGIKSKAYGDEGEVGEAIGKILYEIWKEVWAGVAHDNAGRGRFTKGLVSAMRSEFPDLNWVCVHTEHSTAFDGTRPADWGHSHQEFDLTIGGTVGYEIYYCRSGVFALQGDGGFQNWAWIGNTSAVSEDGRLILFKRP